MSWIFICGNFVYKLKKPVKYKYLDHRSLASRFRDCRREIRLNKTLAPDVYIGLVPLTLGDAGVFQLSGNGEIEDWLVKMKRIPEETMLDYAILHDCIDESRLTDAALLLTDFYKDADSVMMVSTAYKQKMAKEILEQYRELIQPEYKLAEDVIEKITNRLLNFLDKHASVFEKRVIEHRIVEAHGDLRPEHVCLTVKPAIIDRLEFNRTLRILDIAEELSYFAMECEMLGNPLPGKIFFDTYSKATTDKPDRSLILFYKMKRACLRAYLVARHVKEDHYKQDDGWLEKAGRYLSLATKYSKMLIV